MKTIAEIARVGEGKKIHLLEYVTEEQLIVVLSGKQRHVRLVPVRALDGDEVEWIKVAETKGCITLTTGVMRRNPLTYCLCVAIKKQVIFVFHFFDRALSMPQRSSCYCPLFSECFSSHHIRNNAYQGKTQTCARAHAALSCTNTAGLGRRTSLRRISFWIFDIQYFRGPSPYL